MTYFKRFLIIFICGIVQIFYAAYLLLNLFGYNIDWHISNHDLFMFIPGILVFVGSGIFKSTDPKTMADAIVMATAHYDDASKVAEAMAMMAGEPMKGDELETLEVRMDQRGW